MNSHFKFNHVASPELMTDPSPKSASRDGRLYPVEALILRTLGDVRDLLYNMQLPTISSEVMTVHAQTHATTTHAHSDTSPLLRQGHNGTTTDYHSQHTELEAPTSTSPLPEVIVNEREHKRKKARQALIIVVLGVIVTAILIAVRRGGLWKDYDDGDVPAERFGGYFILGRDSE
ncbi:hypothetical protein K435DRAFT_961870 [Dendrothele bispora CBS 962.96]|uniref:Uncharacterized protein n=1 Tax=Dendrothele bispora (strain CBS 962.96) TaxID=1314807 RepID=A0A4S8MNV3_DENBC|nr:hypothetical protein K435DRAFT_961870 [Dendrothele bispora CBS 962.96]